MPIERSNGKNHDIHVVADTTINLLSGEIGTLTAETPGNDIDAWPAKKKDNFYKATKFVAEIQKRTLDLTLNAEDWKSTGESLATFGGHGRDLYHQLAQQGKKYDVQRTNQVYDMLLQSDKLPKSPTLFFLICKNKGINLKEIRQTDEVEVSIKDQLPDNVNPEDYFNNGFYEHDGSYYSVTKAGPQMVCGFTIKVLFLVKSKRNPKRIVELKNKFGYRSILDLPTDAFTSLGAFKKAVESVGNYVFEGNETDLTRLKKKLFQEEKPTLEVTTLGWHDRGQFYAFANGVLNGSRFTETDEYGIVESEKQNFFLPFMSSIYQGHEDYTSEKKFRHVSKPEASFARWAQLTWQAYGLNGAIGICFCMTALFRDLFFNFNGGFPMLFCFGERQSGKSTFAESFKALLGLPQDSISLENPSTVVGVVRTLANFSNGFIVLDEYKNSLDKKLLGLLKGLWDGFGRTTGIKTNDNQTQVIKPRSTVFTMGQDMPTIDNALFTRYILLEFRNENRNYEAYETLKALEKGGLTSVAIEILRYRKDLEKVFVPLYKQTKEFLKGVLAADGIEDRMILNMATILTPAIFFLDANLLEFPFAGKAENPEQSDVRDVFSAFGKKPADSLTAKEHLLLMAIRIIRRQHSQINSSTDARKFWDVFVELVRKGEIKEGIEFRFKDGHLYLRLGNVHSAYLKEHRNQNGLPGQDKQTIMYYLKNDSAFSGIKYMRFNIPGAYNPDGTHKTTTPTSCFGFEFRKLNIDLFSTGAQIIEED